MDSDSQRLDDPLLSQKVRATPDELDHCFLTWSWQHLV